VQQPILSTSSICNKALELGFDACGISSASADAFQQNIFDEWLKKQCNADMKFLERHKPLRENMQLVFENARSVISLAASYRIAGAHYHPNISMYAQVNDYHIALKHKAEILLEYIQATVPGTRGRVFVDTGPVPERYFAAKSGIGFIGKNTCIIHPRFGSYLFLCEIVIDIDAEHTEPTNGSCNNCNRCITACPTGALNGKWLDATRCISYHSIENKSSIPPEIVSRMDNQWFGCDICQQVCPYNQNENSTEVQLFSLIPFVTRLSYKQLEQMSETEFDEQFFNSPMHRTGLSKIRETAALHNENTTKTR